MILEPGSQKLRSLWTWALDCARVELTHSAGYDRNMERAVYSIHVRPNMESLFHIRKHVAWWVHEDSYKLDLPEIPY